MKIFRSIDVIKRFFAPFLIESGYFYRAVAKQAIIPLYSILSILFIKNLVHLIESNERVLLEKYLAYYIGFNLAYFGFVYIARHWGWAESAHHILKMIHRDVMKKFNDLDNTEAENFGTGRIVSIVAKGSETWMNLMTSSIENGLKLVVSLVGAMYILSGVGWLATLLFFVFFLLIQILVIVLNNRALSCRKGRIDTMNEYDRQIVKMIMSKFEILQNQRIGREIAVLDRQVDTAKGYNLTLNQYLNVMFTLPSITFFIITVTTFIVFLRIQISFAEIVSIFMITGVLKDTMESSISFFKDFTKSAYTVEKMWKLFDETPRLEGLDSGEPFTFQNGKIEVENVSFGYRGNTVFSHFSLSIAPGKKTALVGLSGSGKTTFIKLIAGYLKPEEGSIRVDDQDIGQIRLQQYFSHIGYLTQEPSVFDGSIRENLVYGARSEITDEALERAIQLSECSFVYEFEHGLDTEIGEKGIRLSGGQRQRLAIAKIFIKNPEIILLDEPTSALDSFSEEKINTAFKNLFSGRTVIVIAHRLQTVKEADDIIVMDHGKISERGTHQQLIDKAGTYARMLELQSGF